MFKKLNKRAENLTLLDVKLIQLSTFFGAIIVVKLIPNILQLSYLALIVLTLICLFKPFYSFWIKQ